VGAIQALYSLGTVMALVFAPLFYKFGQEEAGGLGVLWAALSLFVSGLVILVLQGGLFAVLFAQLGLMLAIAAVRVLLERKP
jgi:hypothetical protein